MVTKNTLRTYERKKRSFRDEKTPIRDCIRTYQMPFTDQIADIAPCVRYTYFWVAIWYKYHEFMGVSRYSVWSKFTERYRYNLTYYFFVLWKKDRAERCRENIKIRKKNRKGAHMNVFDRRGGGCKTHTGITMLNFIELKYVEHFPMHLSAKF